jgi:hypothetical protein
MQFMNEDTLTHFERFFHNRADVADKLADSGSLIDSLILSTTALDALAEIWLHDFPHTEKALQNNYGKPIPGYIKLAQLLKEFAADDPDANKVAVICFAEDWKRYYPQETTIADQLIDKRRGTTPFERDWMSPNISLDVPIKLLAEECPLLNVYPKLWRLAEEYQYGAILYKFYRCPLVHSSNPAERIHFFTRGDEIMYCGSPQDVNKTAISFGPNLITRWLRHVMSNYIQCCRVAGVIPGKNLDSGFEPEDKLKKRWENFTRV